MSDKFVKRNEPLSFDSSNSVNVWDPAIYMSYLCQNFRLSRIEFTGSNPSSLVALVYDTGTITSRMCHNWTRGTEISFRVDAF